MTTSSTFLPRERPRVLHICTRYLQGSSERRLSDLIRAIPEAEHHLIVGGDSWPALAGSALPATSITVEPSLVRRVSVIDDARAVLRLARLMRRVRPDLMVTHQSKSGVIGRIAALLAGRPPAVHVLSMSSFGPGHSRRASGVLRATERILAPVTTRYATVGADLADRYIALGIPPEKIRVVRSGVSISDHVSPPEARARVIERFGLPEGRPLVVYVASLEARNGAWELPELATRWEHLTPRPFLVVSGTGPLDEALRRVFSGAGLRDHSAFLGYVSDVGDLVAAADAIVLLSRDGGLPELLTQASAAGVPFVSYDVDGARELLSMGAAGVVVPVGEVAAAATGVEEILASGRRSTPLDPGPWSPDEIAAGFRAIVEEVLAP